MPRWGCALALLLSLSTPSAFAEGPDDGGGGDGAEASQDDGGANKMAGVAAHEASLGDKKLKAGDTKGAMVHYGKALKMHSSPDIMIKRATGYMVSGKTEKARKDLDAALGLDPKNLKGLLKRARVHRSLGLFDLAVADWRLLPQSSSAEQSALSPRRKTHQPLVLRAVMKSPPRSESV